jgi:hypothetical protein
LTELIPSLSRLALDRIGNSDALYHNVEDTMLVTLVGYDIMSGRASAHRHKKQISVGSLPKERPARASIL